MKKLLFISFLFFFFAACEKEENYSNTPKIKYESFTFTNNDSNVGGKTLGVLKFSFADGDGNIGSQHKDTIRYPLPQLEDMFVYEYFKVNNEFIVNDTIEYWLPYYEKEVYKSFLKGTIEIKFNHTVLDSDTVYYEFYIRDRSYNESNLETTPVIIYPEE